MKKIMIIVLALVLLLGGLAVSGYNSLVTMNERVNQQWSQVENQIQRRADLIPNLVNTVKGYAQHEEKAIQAVSDARAKLAGAQQPSEVATANDQLSTALGRLLMISENYPDLKANENFRALQDELAGTENRIAVARKDYNQAVQEYNGQIRSFPTNMVAGILGFSARDYFKATEEAQKVPTVQF